MARIEITIGGISDDYEQYQSVIATIVFEKSLYKSILHSKYIDNENEKEDLETVNEFVHCWKQMAEENEMEFATYGVDNFVLDLEQEIEQQEIEEEKTMKRCED